MSAVAPVLESTDAAPRIAVDPRSIDELDAAICRIAGRLHAETYRMLVLLREFDDRFGYAKWCFKSSAEWLAWRCQISLSAAREKVRTAQALRHLPAISAAFAKGRISYSKVRALTRVAAEHDEDLLLAYALNATAPQVEDRCRQLRNVRPESSDLARRALEQRSLTIARNPERGTLTITVEVPAVDGELIAGALDKAVASGEVAQGKDHVAAHGEARNSSDGWRAQQADALVAIARTYLSNGTAASGNASSAAASKTASRAATPTVADHYQLVVHVDAKALDPEALRGGAGRSDLPLETIMRLGCDGHLLALIEDDAGRPLALGRKQRVVSPALRKALYARDRGCTFPGCHRKHYVDAHHLTHWAKGGKTEPENMTLLCSYHHVLLHEGGFAIRRGPQGTLEYLRADGRTIPASGYRLDDMQDDDIHDDEFQHDEILDDVVLDDTIRNDDIHDERTSTEGSCPGCVRETAAVYQIWPPGRRRVRGRAWTRPL